MVDVSQPIVHQFALLALDAQRHERESWNKQRLIRSIHSYVHNGEFTANMPIVAVPTLLFVVACHHCYYCWGTVTFAIVARFIIIQRDERKRGILWASVANEGGRHFIGHKLATRTTKLKIYHPTHVSFAPLGTWRWFFLWWPDLHSAKNVAW